MLVLQQKVISIFKVQLALGHIASKDTHEDLGMDSLAKLEMVMLLESTFDVIIYDEHLPSINTVQDYVNYIHPLVQS